VTVKQTIRKTLATVLFLFLAIPVLRAQAGPFGEWQKSCNAGDADACSSLGMWNKVGGPFSDPDPAASEAWYNRALTIYRNQCSNGKMSACTSLGDLMGFLNKDYVQKFALLSKACNGGDLRGCAFLGGMYRDGQGVSKDNAQAVVHFRRACDGDNMAGCRYLADAYESGDGVAQDKPKAVELYRRACKAKDSTSCDKLKEPEKK
jgi:TPR repeat protein